MRSTNNESTVVVGGIAEPYYKKIPQDFIDICLPLLTGEMRSLLYRLYKDYKLKKSTLVDRMESEGFGDITN